MTASGWTPTGPTGSSTTSSGRPAWRSRRTTGGDALFVGVADTADVDAYLSGVGHDRLGDLGTPWAGAGTRPAMTGVDGGPPEAAPGEVDIWVAESSGTGTQTVDWRPGDGDWTVVIMQADGAAGRRGPGAGGCHRAGPGLARRRSARRWARSWRSSAGCSSSWRCVERRSARPRARRPGGPRRRRGVRSGRVRRPASRIPSPGSAWMRGRRAGVGRRVARSGRRRAAAPGRTPAARARARPGPRPGPVLRRLPDRSAPGRGRPASSPARRRPGTRGRRRGRRRRAGRAAASRSGSGSVWPGSAGPTAAAASAGGGGEPVHRAGVHRLGRRRRVRRRLPGRRAATPTGCRTRWTTSRPPRCCAPASSATAPCAAPTSRRAARWGSTGSAAARTSPPRWRWRRACGCTCSPAGSRTGGSPRSWGRTRSARRPTRRPSRWTARSCSLRPASWCRWPCGRSTAAPRWPSPGSGCRASRGLDYADELFQERRLRSVTANTRADGEEFLRLAGRLGIRATTVGLPHGGGRRPRCADLAHGRFGGAAVLHN